MTTDLGRASDKASGVGRRRRGYDLVMAGEILDNTEAIEAWDGPLFDRFVRFRDIVTMGLGSHGERALELHPPQPSDRVLDVGCGFGDTAHRIAELVGPAGAVLGVDASPRFIESARAAYGAQNVRFEVADVERTAFEEDFDLAFSRFGTMFFANPVNALRNVRKSLRPGGRLCTVVWRRKLDNDWMHRAEVVVADYLTKPEEYDEPTCGPGPFSMANADTVSDIVLAAGYDRVELDRCDIPIQIGKDLDQAIDLVTALGPAGEVIRLLGERASDELPRVDAALRAGLQEFVQPDGSVVAPASTWVVSAVNPVS
jgi:ubiquinone/menaquinone biosynthesis C-methylase UbiE